MSFISRRARLARLAVFGALTALSVTLLGTTAYAAADGAAAPRLAQAHTARTAHTANLAELKGSTGPARGVHIPHRAVAPRVPGTAGSGTTTSTNWDGYTLLSATNTNTNTFTSVSAQWTVPKVTCDPNQFNPQFLGDWVGFDGFLNGSVEQGGTEAFCEGSLLSTTPMYNVWWEMFPFNSIQTGFAVNAGDVIQASVTFSASTSMFDIVVKDVTSGQTLNQNEACQADQGGCVHSSAEIISEDIGGGADRDGLFFLPDYKTTTFTNASVTDVNGHTGPLNDPAWNNFAIAEVSSLGVTKQTVGPLSTDGTSFTTTWQSESGTPNIAALYMTNNTSATTNQLSPQIELVNRGTTSIPLSSVTVRYWFTEDGTGTLNYSCDFVPIGCTNLTSGFVAVTPVMDADHYLQIGFGAGAGSLAPNGGSTGGVQGRIFQSNFANMTQTNDYSFNAADTTFTATPSITVYVDGTLIFGAEPQN